MRPAGCVSSATRAPGCNEGYAVVAIPGLAKPVEHFPDGIVEAMIDNDFEFAANNRRRILAE